MFRCVKILVTGEVQEIELSKSGGLEQDELQKYAKNLFDTPFEPTMSRAILEEQLKQQGQDPSTIDKKLMDSIHAVSVEIKTLLPPSSMNDYIGISMYCDGNASSKQVSINHKATELAMKCGYTTPVLGDVIVSRMHDDERVEWQRLDFTSSEIAADSAWLGAAIEMNKGKNMEKYSSSGALTNMLQNPSTTTTVSSATTTIDATSNHDEGLLQWTQSREDVEIRILLADGYKSKDVKIVMKSTFLSVHFLTPIAHLITDTTMENSSISKIQKGAELFGKINVDESSWSVDGEGAKRGLTITLAKGVEGMRWLTLFR